MLILEFFFNIYLKRSPVGMEQKKTLKSNSVDVMYCVHSYLDFKLALNDLLRVVGNNTLCSELYNDLDFDVTK